MHGGQAENVDPVRMDMSPAFQSGAAAEFQEAEVIFDRFHVTKLVNDAVDHIRRDTRHPRPERV